VVQKVKTLRVLCILNDVLPNSTTKLSEKLRKVLNKMFNVSAVTARTSFSFLFEARAYRHQFENRVSQTARTRVWSST